MPTCTVAKGSIFYEEIGTGRPIIILHSMGTDHRSMKLWLEEIFNSTDEIKRIYVDLPAHGQSKIDDSFQSTDDMLGNLLEFIERIMPTKSFSIIGASYGGYLAQGILDSMSEKVISICLLAPATHVAERDLPKRTIVNKEENLYTNVPIDVKNAFETLMVVHTRRYLKTFLDEVQPGRNIANREFLTSNWKEKGYFLSKEPFSHTHDIDQPALLILGKYDSIVGYKDHVALLDKFSNMRFVVLENAGHMLHIEKRKVVQHLIRGWLQEESKGDKG